MFKYYFYLKDDNLRFFLMMDLIVVIIFLVSVAMVLGLVCLCLFRYVGGRFFLVGFFFLY